MEVFHYSKKVSLRCSIDIKSLVSKTSGVILFGVFPSLHLTLMRYCDVLRDYMLSSHTSIVLAIVVNMHAYSDMLRN